MSEARSRGLLVLDLAHATSAAEAAKRCVVQLNQQAYNGFNILCADRKEVWRIQHTGHSTMHQRLIGPLHVVTNGEVDDRSEPRIERAWQTLEPVAELDLEKVAPAIQRMLAERGTAPDDPAAMCLYGEQSGTISSTILAVATPRTHVLLARARAAGRHAV